MATEVSCGQCQGRLLVETLGVVVACPHCGTHLSIPAPETPVPTPPTPEPFAAAPDAVIAPTPAFVETPPTPVLEFPAAAPEIDHVEQTVAESSHGAATLPAPTPYVAPASPSKMFTAPLLEPEPVEPTTEPPADWAPAVPPQPAESVVEAAPPVPEETIPEIRPGAMELKLSATQQLSLGAIAEEAAKSAPNLLSRPVLSEAPPAERQSGPITFGAAPAAAPDAAPASLSFGAAPTEPIPAMAPLTFTAASSTPPAPVTFGAAPAAATPITRGAAPASAPLSFGAAPSAPVTFGAAPTTVAPVTVPTTTVAEEAAAFAESEMASRQKFQFMLLIIIGSYASCVTIVLIYMLIRGQASNLESLPDLAPPRGANGQLSWKYNPPKNDLAVGHVLSLGQSRRFGNVKVTPLKVTRGPVKFEHFTREPGMTREPTPPVLKLWVKFENVSRNQTFAPVDPYVLFTRKSVGLSGPVQANSFVATLANQRQGKSVSYIYDMPKESEFRMVGQNLSLDLEPGEKLETFIPSEEDAVSLSGDLVWRFQFRKGYNPSSKRGVTTLIDVRFNSRDITDERGA